MPQPEISVIIPVYKVEKYIRECLESVLAQTMKDIEIIVVNDGSPDHSAEIARECAAGDGRVKFIDQHNQGLSAARNAGMKIASAPLVMFVDSDDMVEPDCCQVLFDAFTDDVDVVLGGRFTHFYEDMEPDPDYERRYNNNFDNINRYSPTSCNKIFRMSIIRSKDIEYPVGCNHEDEYFWNAYLPWCRKISVVPDSVYRRRMRGDSIMGLVRTGGKTVNTDYLRILAALGDYYHSHGLLENDEWAEHYWRVFDSLVRSAQRHRPERFKPKKKKKFRKLRRLFGLSVK